jgi:hypothetical protein
MYDEIALSENGTKLTAVQRCKTSARMDDATS